MTHNNEALQKVLVDVNRVTKVVKGGRIFSFAALVVVGDNNGMVGYGTGKAKEVNEASAKGAKEAKNKMIKVYLERGTIPHDVRGDFGATRVFLRKAEPGTGIIAGGPLRVIFACLGVDDIVAKSYGSKNTAALILATFNALSKLYSPKQIAARRGKVLSEIFQS